LADTQTLTNKTLTTPVIGSLLNTTGGTMTVPQTTTSDTFMLNAYAAAVTNKTFGAGVGFGIPVTAATSVNLTAYGISAITSSSAAGLIYVMDDPSTGIPKFIVVTCGATSSVTTYIKSTSATFDGTNPVVSMVTATHATLKLIGGSTSRWYIESVYPSTAVLTFAATT
jgi:hypothetical protein